MRFLTPLRRFVTRLAYRRRFNGAWSKRLATLDVWPFEFGSQSKEGGPMLPGLTQPITAASTIGDAVIRKYRTIADLANRAAAKVELGPDRVTISVDGITAVAYGEADIQVFHEIFVERIYQFELPGPFHFVDAGANIGLASLFFARQYGGRVTAYELVPSTVEIAKENIALNPELAGMIDVAAAGWSDAAGSFEIAFDSSRRTSNSLLDESQNGKGPVERVSVLDAADEFQRLLNTTGDTPIVLKLDIEGAEYVVLRRLAEARLLQKCKVLFIEWHRVPGHDPEEIREILRQEGYHWFEDQHALVDVGMIRAFRS